ncbi:MAG: hypothetical protein ACI4MT_05660 [Christensenellales bacterium]
MSRHSARSAFDDFYEEFIDDGKMEIVDDVDQFQYSSDEVKICVKK